MGVLASTVISRHSQTRNPFENPTFAFVGRSSDVLSETSVDEQHELPATHHDISDILIPYTL